MKNFIVAEKSKALGHILVDLLGYHADAH